MSKNIFLKKLNFTNFKGIKRLEIDFLKITNVFGDNGTGKTSIFDGFTWLLFDKDCHDRVVGDKESNFQIKPYDSQGNIQHGLETKVTGILSINGKDLVLTKTYKEKWTKRHGEAEKQLTGHTTDYYINDIPVKKLEYQKKINEIIEEKSFKLLSNPLYFGLSVKKDDRRDTLMEIVGNVADEDVITYNHNLNPLEKLLSDTDIETLRKGIAAKKTKLNADIKAIPIRVDEANNSIKELDFISLAVEKNTLQRQIENLEEQLIDSSKANEGILKEKDKLYQLKSSLKDLEYKLTDKAKEPLKDLRVTLSDLNTQLLPLQSSKHEIEYKISNFKSQIDTLNAQNNNLRKDFFKWQDKKFEFPEDKKICPTCHRPIENIEEKVTELEGNFNENKARQIEDIRTNGKTNNSMIEKLNAKIDDLEKLRFESQQKIDDIQSQKDTLDKEISEFTPNLDFSSNEECTSLQKSISELEAKLQQPKENTQLNELKQQKRELQSKLDEVNSQLAYENTNKELQERIEKLKLDERILSQQFADLEKQELLTSEFIKTKVELLEGNINSKFNYVKFKLFNVQVNGALTEECEALVDGVPFSNANTASQYNAGLDIINALSSYYGVSTPIFIDNRESVNNILEAGSQIINLIVSKDKALKIEMEE